MKLKFTKMHGAGNDFVVLDATRNPLDLSPQQWRQLGDRRFGVGADQMLVVEGPDQAGVDFRYRIFNADGGEVEQCGNGSRAFVKYVIDKGLTEKRQIRVSTKAGIIEPKMEADGSITVDMGPPRFSPNDLPFDVQSLTHRIEAQDTLWNLPLSTGQVEISIVSMGNPHAVQVVDDVDTAPVATLGPEIEKHPRFPHRVNAGFMQILEPHHIRLRVYERGAGETLACGTGACAAVVAGIRRGLLQSPVQVDARGGTLSIAWNGQTSPVFLSGPAVTVFEGEIELTD